MNSRPSMEPTPRRRHVAPAMLGTALLLALATPAHAAVDFFVKIPDIPGDSQDATHKGEIEALSYSLAVSHNGPNGSVAFEELLFTHNYDSGSPLFFQRHAGDVHIPKIDLLFRKAGVPGPFNYWVITLTDARVTSIRQGEATGADIGTEQVGLRFSKIEFKYTPQKADGRADTSVTSGYDLTTGQAL